MATRFAICLLRIANDYIYDRAEVVVRTIERYRRVPERSSQQPCRFTGEGRVENDT